MKSFITVVSVKNGQPGKPPPDRGPRPARTSGVAMSAPRAALLDQLEACVEPVTVAELARSSGLHPNTVREHLEALERAGLVLREAAPPRGRGRPAWLYRAVVPPPTSSEYAGLATALADSLRRTSTDPVTDAAAAGWNWGRRLAAERPRPDRPGPATARAAVTALLTDLGFAPEPEPASGRGPARVRLTTCPLLAAARQHPDIVCAVHLGLLRGAVQAYGGRPEQVDLEPFAEPGACLLHLARGEAAP